MCDHKGEHTIFGQVYNYLKKGGDFTCFRQNSTDSKAYRANFIGEASIDAGGPFRE